MIAKTRVALLTFARMSGWIVAPVLGGLFLGHYIDTLFVITPYGVLISLIVCFFISIAGIIREANKARDDMKKPSDMI